METTPPSPITELEAAFADGSSAKRTAILRRVTDLFLDVAPRMNDAQLGAFDDIFEQLTREIEWKAKLELSERMADVENAPERLVRRLAEDEAIEVSGPVLAGSPRLDPDDLVTIARTGSQAHLAAIASRTELCEQVTGMLVEHGDIFVARKVASNKGARFTETSLRSLVDRAGDDSDLARAVARRRELSPAMFRSLLVRATEDVRRKLIDTAQPGTVQVINKILQEVSESLARKTVPKRDYAGARQTVTEMQKQGGVTAPNLLQFARDQKLEEVGVTLAQMTGVSVEIVDRFLDDPADDPILILCKAIDLEWPTALAVLAAKIGTAQVRESRADDANKKYRKLSTYSAQRVLRFWQAREKLASTG